ncbi:molybdenum cofactor guanylyltransferase [Corynebacterium vitaeruminis]|uniref:Putative molybdopterin-guanine dinucleotide biosynthesis protein A n=1 Tax=Corynebacterium vitaeruminis DSM 20294 TaxID=1224164 RepID=W5XY65_9CORY|nr:NTP transferase domain-containing protein [Corynebacterium vitaeruminis]AHI21862.1 putative molybdopterin-guanine dinucleotide biosynthesis protein A [Corynebacterium vitaeruminis DSM 20294]
MPTTYSVYSVIVLAGGRSSRMGADKAQVLLDGRRLIDHVLSGVAALPDPPAAVAVVSPVDLGLDAQDFPFALELACEQPAFGGPVAGIDAGIGTLARHGAARVAILSVDAPRSPACIPRLLGALGARADAAQAVVEGHRQPLLVAWDAAALGEALAALPQVRDSAAKRLYSDARVALVSCPGLARDFDSPGELAALGEVSLPPHPDF